MKRHFSEGSRNARSGDTIEIAFSSKKSPPTTRGNRTLPCSFCNVRVFVIISRSLHITTTFFFNSVQLMTRTLSANYIFLCFYRAKSLSIITSIDVRARCSSSLNEHFKNKIVKCKVLTLKIKIVFHNRMNKENVFII